jgi:hypothetical protein
LLILDGHSSRNYFEAISILAQNSIEVLILPPHSTHILQPFDIAIGSPLKSYFQQNLQINLIKTSSTSIEIGDTLNLSKEFRKTAILTFLDAWYHAASPKNIESGFSKAGIYPFNPQIPLENGLLLPEIPNEAKRSTKKSIISGKHITSPEMLTYLQANSNSLFTFSSN